MGGKLERAIHELAEGQQGYFTVGQAAQHLGISADRVRDLCRREVVERVSRGVYRLTRFPMTPFAQYMEAVLWPAAYGDADVGVLSHESALAFYDLSDVNPAKVHITVSPTRRIRRQSPAYLVVHYAPTDPADVQVREGIPTTTPLRTIRDCAAAHLGPALVRQAINDARAAGWLTGSAADSLTAELTSAGKL